MRSKLRELFVSGTLVWLWVAPALSHELQGIGRAAPADISEVDREGIDIYQSQMRAAMSMADPRLRDAAITSARLQLVQTIGKPLTAQTIAELDGLLDIGGASPQLGAVG